MPQQATKTRQEFLPEPAFRGQETPEAPVSAAKTKFIGQLRLLWSERRTLRRLAFAGLAVGTLLALLLPKQYQSTVQLMPPDSQSNSAAMLAALGGRAGGGISAMAGDLVGGKSTGVLFVGILRSRTLEDRLVQRFDLKREYAEKLTQDACLKLASQTSITEDRKSGIISIAVVDHDPARAAAIAQAYVEELERLVSELSTSSAHRERVFLEERLKVVQRELDQAAGEFSRFASQNTAINVPEQGKAMVEAAATLQGHLIAAESELKGLSEIYTANNVRVRSVQARVTELRHQLENLDGNSSPAKPGTRPGDQAAYPSIRELPLLGVTYAALLRRTKIEEAVYETLSQQFELAKVQEAKETPSVKILDAASVPERKSFPPRLWIMFCSACFGLAGGVGVVLAQAQWDRTDPSDPAKALAGEVFRAVNAEMPWAPPNGSPLRTMVHRAWMRFARENRQKDFERARPLQSSVGKHSDP